jgi:hypothetical protein
VLLRDAAAGCKSQRGLVPPAMHACMHGRQLQRNTITRQQPCRTARRRSCTAARQPAPCAGRLHSPARTPRAQRPVYDTAQASSSSLTTAAAVRGSLRGCGHGSNTCRASTPQRSARVARPAAGCSSTTAVNPCPAGWHTSAVHKRTPPVPTRAAPTLLSAAAPHATGGSAVARGHAHAHTLASRHPWLPQPHARTDRQIPRAKRRRRRLA